MEIVQAYIGDIVTSYSWTDRELKAFQRVALEPGETKTVASRSRWRTARSWTRTPTASSSPANSNCSSATPRAVKT